MVRTYIYFLELIGKVVYIKLIWQSFQTLFRPIYPGLFTADQNVQGVTSRHTRQNRNGKRYGYECPEERDYYPYFHPTDWIDIAVLIGNVSHCDYYKNESFNTQPKGKVFQTINLHEFHNKSILQVGKFQQVLWHHNLKCCECLYSSLPLWIFCKNLSHCVLSVIVFYL
jgi:hypothetical protein